MMKCLEYTKYIRYEWRFLLEAIIMLRISDVKNIKRDKGSVLTNGSDLNITSFGDVLRGTVKILKTISYD